MDFEVVLPKDLPDRACWVDTSVEGWESKKEVGHVLFDFNEQKVTFGSGLYSKKVRRSVIVWHHPWDINLHSLAYRIKNFILTDSLLSEFDYKKAAKRYKNPLKKLRKFFDEQEGEMLRDMFPWRGISYPIVELDSIGKFVRIDEFDFCVKEIMFKHGDEVEAARALCNDFFIAGVEPASCEEREKVLADAIRKLAERRSKLVQRLISSLSGSGLLEEYHTAFAWWIFYQLGTYELSEKEYGELESSLANYLAACREKKLQAIVFNAPDALPRLAPLFDYEGKFLSTEFFLRFDHTVCSAA